MDGNQMQTESKEDKNMNNDLMSLLYQSSHFLHHRKGGKRGQRRILTLLAQNPGISQKELQDRLGIESGSMSELVIKLEHKGLITRTKDEADKRMSNLTITDLGLELSKELEDLASADEKLLLGSLDAGEQEQLKLLLSKLVTSWEEAEKLPEDGHHHKRCFHSGEQDPDGHHGGCGHHGHHGHHRDHDHHSDLSAHDEESNHHHGHKNDQDRRGHHLSGKNHENHHHRHN